MSLFSDDFMYDFREAVRGVLREELGPEIARLRSETARLSEDGGAALVNVQEAARRLGIAVSTVRNRAQSCALPSIKDGARLLFKVADLDAYVEQHRRSPEAVLRVLGDSKKKGRG